MTDSAAFAAPVSDNYPLSDTPVTRVLGASSDDPLVAEYLLAARADNTRRAYAADLRDFERWGGQLPSTPDAIACYLAYSAQTVRPATLRRRLAAFAAAHHDHGFVDPTKHPLIRRVMQGIERRHGAPTKQVAPLLINDLALVVAIMGNSPEDRRDRAMLLVGFFAALRRSELVQLSRFDVELSNDQVTLTIRKSKTDQCGEGRRIHIPARRDDLCPVEALNAWLSIKEPTIDPVFPTAGRNWPLSTRAIARTIKKWARAAGLEPENFSGHSLRAGFATSAALAGWNMARIARRTGHRTQQALAAYVRSDL